MSDREEATALRGHIPLLDGLRGVAALAVVASHFQNLSGLPLHVRHAGVAVDFFFGLSGFVVAQAYERRLAGGLTTLAYLRIRLARLYPAILGALVIAAGLTLWSEGALYPAMGLQFLLLPVLAGPVLNGGEIFPLNGPQWSLFWELAINAVHAALVPWLTTPRLVGAVGLAAVALVFTSARFNGLDVGWSRATVLGGLPRVVYGFGIGVLIFRAAEKGHRAAAAPWWIATAALIMCLVGPFPDAVPDRIADPIVVIVVLPTILALAIRATTPRWLFGGLTWLGGLSYPLYAIHVPLLRGFAAVLDDAPETWRPAGWWVALAATLLGAALFERFYDLPIRRWLGRLSKRTAAVRGASG
jgi:peptidoglycan/LPS O-acetylase OafA/YrhL